VVDGGPWDGIACDVPAASIRSASYSFGSAAQATPMGSMTVCAGSSISTRMCGNSSSAPLRTSMRGQALDDRGLPSGRIRLVDALPKS